MQTLTFKAPETLGKRLEALAEKLDRNKSYVIRKAVESYLAEQEEEEQDYRIALERLAQDTPSRRISFADIKRKHGLED